jgi:hypothetical protein
MVSTKTSIIKGRVFSMGIHGIIYISLETKARGKKSGKAVENFISSGYLKELEGFLSKNVALKTKAGEIENGGHRFKN